jgi:tripartite-type tricarboxylate transporter receptor subunit TctC
MMHLFKAVIAAGLSFAIALPTASMAQSYPSKPIRMTVGYGPGSGADILARIIAEKLAQQMKVPVIVDNISGAGGAVAATLVSKAPGDGYTILLVAAALTVSPSLISPKPYDAVKDFVAVTKVAVLPLTIVTSVNAPFKTFSELIDYAKANPGKITYATSGKGTASHLEMELIRLRYSLELVDAPYKNLGQAMIDTIGGQISLYFPAFPVALPHIRSGMVRALAIGSAQRSEKAPDIPTLAELMGVPGYEASVWYGIVAPKGTPEDIVARLDREIQSALASPDARARIEKTGSELSVAGREHFGPFIRSEVDKWAKLVKQFDLKAAD